jgi:hypothetical protein
MLMLQYMLQVCVRPIKARVIENKLWEVSLAESKQETENVVVVDEFRWMF